jgi:transcriptional regulator with XRE-family HTH domain
MLICYVDNYASVPFPGRSWPGSSTGRNPARSFLAVWVRRLEALREAAESASSSRGDLIITREARFEPQLNKPRDSTETLDLLRNLLGFSDQELARALGVTDRSVKRWRAGGRISTESEERLFDLMRTVAALAELELPPANIRAWFFYRNRFLHEERPIDVFHTGRYEALRPAIDAISDASFA